MFSGLIEIGIVIGLFAVFYYLINLKDQYQEKGKGFDVTYYVLLATVLISSVVVGALFHGKIMGMVFKIPLLGKLVGSFYRPSQTGGSGMESMDDEYDDMDMEDFDDEGSVIMDGDFDDEEFY